MRPTSKFIMIDGIAGSGKSTIIRAIQTWMESSQQRIWRLSDWTEIEPPRFENISDFDVYFTYEPSRTWIGRAIRYELSREDQPYGGEELAHAFSLDREIMYRRLIIPALKAGKTIVQDRGVSTSLVYQPIMYESLSLEMVMKLPGNKLALEYPPSALILTKLSAQTAYERMNGRQDDSKGVFGQLEFLKKLEQRFAEPWLKELFESRDTIVHELDTSGTPEATCTQAQKLIQQILTT